MSQKTVVVGLSGGVDSSVTAALLQEAGYHVIGLFMKNWEEEGECPAAMDAEDVALVSQQLGIAHYTVNFAKEYWERVFARCLEEYRAGYTPNPDILCNQEIKFRLFFDKALALGADYVATGHYARIVESPSGPALAKGLDPEKDQSYFLYTLKSQILEKVLFPVGGLPKKEVRRIALEKGLVTAQKKDSTGICFIGKRDFKEFLSRYITPNPGPFMTLSGKVIGTHDGVAYYTIGQRKGLRIGGEGEAWFVVEKDPLQNVIYVEQGDDHPALYKSSLSAKDVTWIGPTPQGPFKCMAKVRYRSPDVPCSVEMKDEGLFVTFETPQKAITPYQSIVFYQGDVCLGGARIQS